MRLRDRVRVRRRIPEKDSFGISLPGCRAAGFLVSVSMRWHLGLKRRGGFQVPPHGNPGIRLWARVRVRIGEHDPDGIHLPGGLPVRAKVRAAPFLKVGSNVCFPGPAHGGLAMVGSDWPARRVSAGCRGRYRHPALLPE